MRWLERHAWWGLLFIGVVLAVFGATDVASGAAADPAIPLGLTGLTNDQLEAESAAAYRAFDFMTRTNGWSLLMLGILLAVVTAVPYRNGERWGWLVMWLLPIWSAGVALFYVVAGTDPNQPPPPPMVSGPFIAVMVAAILLVSVRRFFPGRQAIG